MILQLRSPLGEHKVDEWGYRAILPRQHLDPGYLLVERSQDVQSPPILDPTDHSKYVIRVETEGPIPTWLPYVLQRMTELLELPSGWDGYGAPSIRLSAAIAAIDSLGRLIGPDEAAPTIVPASSGGVQVEWSDENADLEIEFFPSGQSEAFVAYADGGEWEGSLDKFVELFQSPRSVIGNDRMADSRA